MLRWLKRVSVATVVLLLAMQAYRPARTNPAFDPAHEIHAVTTMDPQIAPVFNRSCDDCHSNRTAWPWYSKIAPASWLVVSDVNRGRAALNFSEWGRYDAGAQQKHLKEICGEVSEGEMPAAQYLLMHPRARLSATERQAVCRWTRDVAGKAPAAATAD